METPQITARSRTRPKPPERKPPTTIAELQTGDPVLWYPGGWSKLVYVKHITRTTPTRLVIGTHSPEYFPKNDSDSVWALGKYNRHSNRSRIAIASPEKLAKVAREERHRELWGTLERLKWNDLPLEKLEQIIKITERTEE